MFIEISKTRKSAPLNICWKSNAWKAVEKCVDFAWCVNRVIISVCRKLNLTLRMFSARPISVYLLWTPVEKGNALLRSWGPARLLRLVINRQVERVRRRDADLCLGARQKGDRPLCPQSYTHTHTTYTCKHQPPHTHRWKMRMFFWHFVSHLQIAPGIFLRESLSKSTPREPGFRQETDCWLSGFVLLSFQLLRKQLKLFEFKLRNCTRNCYSCTNCTRNCKKLLHLKMRNIILISLSLQKWWTQVVKSPLSG